MKNWLKIHQALLAAAIAVMAFQLLIYMLILRPQQSEVQDMKAAIDKKRQRLTGSEWPLQADKLEKFHALLKERLEGPAGMQKRYDDIMQRAGMTFHERIKENHHDAADFMRGVSRLDYQENFHRVQKLAAGFGVFLAPEVLKLAEDTATDHIYQAMLQIWTVESVLGLISSSGLKVVNHPDLRVEWEGTKHQVAQLSVETMEAYFADGRTDRPYLLEFPVRVTLAGQQDQFLSFLHSLDSDSVFLTVRRFECQLVPPAAAAEAPLQVDISCSAFFCLDDRAGTRRTQSDSAQKQ